MTTSIRLYSIVFLAIIGLASMANGQMTGNTMATDSVATDSLQPIPESAIVDEVIWVVGDEAILKSDVEAMRLQAAQEGQRWDGDPDCVIPEQIAVQKLFLHQAAIDSIEVSQSDISQMVERQINGWIQMIGSKEKLEEYKKQTVTQMRNELNDVVRDRLMAEKMQKKLVEDISVTPAEVRRFFNNLSQDSIPYVPTEVEVQILTQTPKIEQEEIIPKTRDQPARAVSSTILVVACLILPLPTWLSISPTRRRCRRLSSLNSVIILSSSSISVATRSRYVIS